MHILKLYFKIAKRYKKMIFAYTCIFMTIFIIFSSSVMKNKTEQYQDVKIEVAYIDQDKSEMSKLMKSFLQENATIINIGTDEEAQKDALFYQQVKAIITIPKDFSKAFLEGNPIELQVVQLPNDARGGVVIQKMKSYLNTFAAYQKGYPKDSVQQLDRMVTKNMAKKADIQLQNKSETNTSSAIRSTIFFNYLSYVLISVIVMIEGLTMHSIFKSEVMKRNVVAPIKSYAMNLQLLLGNLALGIGLWLLYIIVICILNPQGMFTGTGIILAGNAFLFMIMCVSLAFLLTALFSNFVHAEEAMNGATNILGLGCSFLGGAFLPQMMMSEQVLQFSKFLPTYWYVKLNDLFGYGNTASSELLQQVLVTYGILILFAVAFLGIALTIMKSRRRQGVLIDTTNA